MLRRSADSGSPASSFCIEEMLESDLGAVLQIEQLSFAHPWSRNNFVYELNNRVAVNRVVRHGGTLVAYLCAWLVVDELKVNNVAVHGDWRRKGLARRLLLEVLTQARAAGCRVVTLEVRASNQSALQLYREIGFQEDARRDNYYPTDGEAAVLMSLTL